MTPATGARGRIGIRFSYPWAGKAKSLRLGLLPRGKRKGLVTRGTDLAGHFRIGETLAENMRKHTLKPLPLERESALLVEVSSRSMAPLT